MSKPPSEKTQLVAARREIKELKADLSRVSGLANEYRVRATKAETEVTEWKRRFDLLLSREPVNGVPPR